MIRSLYIYTDRSVQKHWSTVSCRIKPLFCHTTSTPWSWYLHQPPQLVSIPRLVPGYAAHCGTTKLCGLPIVQDPKGSQRKLAYETQWRTNRSNPRADWTHADSRLRTGEVKPVTILTLIQPCCSGCHLDVDSLGIVL